MTNYDYFSETFSESRKNLFWPELDVILDDILLHNFSSILDIGCGSGRFLEFFQKKFHILPQIYCGVDNSLGMICEAKKAFSDQCFIHEKMQNITLQKLNNQQFDAIVLLASFHHLQNPLYREQTLQNLRQILAPGGRIYMTNWNLRDQQKYQKSQKSPGEFYIKIGQFERYYHGFTLIELQELFTNSGFEMEYHQKFGNGRNFLSILKNPD